MTAKMTKSEDCCFISPSYFYFSDNERQYTGSERYYFTYFTRYDNNTSDDMKYYEAAFFITNCILSLPLNILVLITIARNKELRSVCNVFICNMTLTDLLYGLIGPLLALVNLEGDWNLGDPMCHLIFYLQSVCGCVVCWSIAAVSLDRYLHIVHPMNTSMTITFRRATIIIAAIWVIAISSMSPIGIFFQVTERPMPYSNRTAHVCTLLWPENDWYAASIMFVVDITVVCFLLPVGLMLWCYYRCIKQIGSISRTLVMRMDSLGSITSLIDIKKRRAIRDYRVMRTFMTLFVLFVIAWGPFFCVLPFIVSDVFRRTTIMQSRAFVWTVGLAQFNSVVNPVAYGLSMQPVRKKVLERLQGLC